MVTNPNTVGVFEENIQKICSIMHDKGALVYMDGANMNALVGVTRPGDFGVDVMHLNLHKTFSTPHGGGGPGSGAVAVAKVLTPISAWPSPQAGKRSVEVELRPSAVDRTRARLLRELRCPGRALAYIMAHGGNGLRQATLDALLNANYLRTLLEPYYELAYKSASMHECVFSDDRQAKKGVRTGDIAKRLIDYGFHPYTVSFPLIVRGALMIEPTETESKRELDLFADAMISIAKKSKSRRNWSSKLLIPLAPGASTKSRRLESRSFAGLRVLRQAKQPISDPENPLDRKLGNGVVARTVTLSPRGAHTSAL